ncbi:MAG: hypothetical protein KAH14_02640 [Clostridiales bacterium]|nr:hypothetical protein [Clostridiales bacterium]
MIEGMQKHIVRGLLAGLCLLWLVFGIITLGNDIVLGIMLIINGLCFGFFAFLCKSKTKLLQWLFYIFIVANAILTVTDQMGIFDWIVLILYVLLISLLIIEDKKM